MNRLPACRVCLAYETRLCSIMDGQLRDVYETLVEASLITEDMLPTSVCYICISFMKKMLQFRDRAQKANQILQQMISSGLEISVSSLDKLVKDQTGISWTLGSYDTDRTTNTTSGEDEVKVKIECVKLEMDIEEINDWNEGAASPERRKLDKIEAENESVNIQASLWKNEKDEEPREKEEYVLETETNTSNIMNEIHYYNALNKNDMVKPQKNEYTVEVELIELNRNANSINSELKVTNECKSTNVLEVQEIQSNDNLSETNKCRRDIKRSKGKQYQCRYCMKHFTSSSNLSLHLRIHTGQNLHKCEICGKGFSQRGHLTRHYVVHTKEKPFKCDICDKGFSQRSHLTYHFKVHNKEKPFKCDICEKYFTQSGELNRHLRVHTKRKPFKCYLCEKCFSNRVALTQHLRVHTKEKPFKCDQCEKCFTIKETLSRHSRVHTKEKPFKCDACEKDFTQNSNLIRHLRVHTKEKPLKCDLCEKSFSRKETLTSHLRVHTKEKPFKCDVCEKDFTQKSALIRHLRVHHTRENSF